MPVLLTLPWIQAPCKLSQGPDQELYRFQTCEDPQGLRQDGVYQRALEQGKQCRDEHEEEHRSSRESCSSRS